MKQIWKRTISVLLCAALLAALWGGVPALAAGDLFEDFEGFSEGAEFTSAAFNAVDIAGGGIVSRTIRTDNGDKYMEMSAQNTAESTQQIRNRIRTAETYSGTFTVEWDGNFCGGKLDVYLRQGGNVRATINEQGRVYLQVLDAARVPNVMHTVAGETPITPGKWYTFKAELTPDKATLTWCDKLDGNKPVGELTTGQDNSVFEKLYDPYNIWLDMWGAADLKKTANVSVAIDNFRVTEGKYEGVKSPAHTKASTLAPAGSTPTAAAAGVMVVEEDFESFAADSRYGTNDKFNMYGFANGGIISRTVKESGGNKYLLMRAWNTVTSTAGPRNQVRTNENVSDVFTVEWDYNNVSAVRGKYFDVYLRQGGNVRVRITDQGEVRLLVLSSVTAPGQMETAISDVKLETNVWYNMKAEVTPQTITLDVFCKDRNNEKVTSLTIGQSDVNFAKLYDPYNIWFDLWGLDDVNDSTYAAVAVDNIHVYTGKYEGMKNASIKTPAAEAVNASGESAAPVTADAATPMTDVGMSAWYRPAVIYALENKLMSGYNAYTFGPYDTLSRAMVVQVLYNKEGQPATGDPNPFSDVPQTQWYHNAVRWGAAKNVVAGYGGGVFKPDDPVTVEQVAVILHNYSGKPAGKGDTAALGEHSDWAEAALAWAAESGLLNGLPYDVLTDPANRAQTAQMLMNYLKK